MSRGDSIARQLRDGIRTLVRNPGFTATALVVLSLGIGTISALFSVVDKVLLEPLPYRDPNRLVQLVTKSKIGEESLSSIPKFLFWRDTTKSFESIAASDIDGPAVNLTESHTIGLKTARVSADYFQTLGAELAMGRTFSAREDSPGGPKTVVMSDALWRTHFHSEPGILDREIGLDNIAYKVVGVLAPGARLESSADIWLPLCADRRSTDHIGRVRVIARLRSGVSLKEAQKEVISTLERFLRRHPPDSQFGAPILFGQSFEAIPLRDAVVGDVRPALYLLMGAGGFLLSISCVNAATLLLARASRRTREIAIRLATGAHPRQILAQLLTEAVLLSFASGIGGLLLGYVGVRALLSFSPADLPRIGANGSAITLDWRVFLFTLLLSVLIGVLCGAAPAANASRTDINVLVKENSSQSGMNLRRNRWRSSLMIAEVAFSLVLLAGAGLMIRTFVAKRAVNRGFDESNIVMLDMSLSNPRFDKATQVAQLVRHVERRVKSVPGVMATATTCAPPLASSFPMPFTIVRNDHSMVGRYDGTATWRSVSPQYFKVFQIRLLRGRLFSDADNETSAGVALINREMAKRYWQGLDASPIGDFITIGEGIGPRSAEPPTQIIGIVADVRDAGLDPEPAMYVPVAQLADWLNARNNRLRPIIWTVRMDGKHPFPAPRIQEELFDLSGGQPLGHLRTMHEAIVESSARTQFYMILLVVFAGVALVITATGLYSLMTYAVRQRMEEIAIRSALGATPRALQRLITLQALRLTLWGTLAGVPLALALCRVTLSFIFGIQTWDPVMFAAAMVLLCVVSLAAAYVPSVRASQVSPARALRP